MAEVHIIGQITGANNFPFQSIFCKWNVHCENNWKIAAGKKEGQTQVSSSVFEQNCKWNFPIDVHLATSGISGWPKIYIQVYHLDWLGRSHLLGYGFVTIPSTPGSHKLNCYTWRPFGNFKERFVQSFLGNGPQLKHLDLVFTKNDRYKLNTESMGFVSFDIDIVLRNFLKFGVEYK